MKAITLRQPWASLVAIGEKTIETKPYHTAHRGELAIHSARDAMPVNDPYYRSLLIKAGLEYSELPCGMILAVGRLIRCEKITEANCPCYPEYAFSDFKIGWYAWYMDSVKPLDTPIPARGRRGLWNWTPPKNFRHE